MIAQRLLMRGMVRNSYTVDPITSQHTYRSSGTGMDIGIMGMM